MNEDIQWHPPFRGAVKIELDEYKDILEYIDEKTLTKKPLLIDLLVIKKQADEKISNPIGNIFRTWNIMEYKSPTDYISIDDFYKVSAYAYLLKSNADTIDEIKFQDITLSFVSSSMPQNVFEHLEKARKYKIVKYSEGVYYFLKECDIPVQFIILNDIGSSHKWLAALTNQITKEMLHNLVKDYKEEEKNEYKEAVIDAVFKANYEFIKMLKEEKAMSKELLELFRPEIEEEKQEAKQEERIEMALKLFEINLPLHQIKEVTNLSEIEIQKIISDNHITR